jgi:hypothetical protein
LKLSSMPKDRALRDAIDGLPADEIAVPESLDLAGEEREGGVVGEIGHAEDERRQGRGAAAGEMGGQWLAGHEEAHGSAVTGHVGRLGYVELDRQPLIARRQALPICRLPAASLGVGGGLGPRGQDLLLVLALLRSERQRLDLRRGGVGERGGGGEGEFGGAPILAGRLLDGRVGAQLDAISLRARFVHRLPGGAAHDVRELDRGFATRGT